MNLEYITNELENAGYKVELMPIDKGYGYREALVVRPAGSNLGPIFYIDTLEERHELDDALINHIVACVEDATKTEFDVEEVVKFENARSSIRLCTRPMTDMDIPKYSHLDLEFYARLFVTMGTQEGSIVITNKMLDEWNITSEDLFNYAIDNTHYCFQDVMGMLVITTDDSMFGASALDNTFFLSKLGRSCYIIPSSVHELLVVFEPYSEEQTEFLKEMVAQVNKTEVAPADVLSYNVYYFDYDTSTVKIAFK